LIGSILVSGNFSQTNNCGITVSVGANCAIQVQFTPTATGVLTGNVSISDNAAGSPQVISLSGTGVSPVTLSPASFSFANTAVGYTAAAMTLTLTNNQSAAISLRMSFGGNNRGDFAIISGGTCGSSLGAKSKCTVLLTFTPSAASARSATLTLTDSPDPSSPYSIALSGTGLAPVAISSSSLAFGTISLDSTSSAKTSSVTNNQPVSISLNRGLSGTNSRDFAITRAGTCGSSLAAKSQCSYSITFTPTATGPRAATLVIRASPDPNSPHQVALSGTGR
jgi:hypothetical protein